MTNSRRHIFERICAKAFQSSLTCSIFGFTVLLILYLLDWKRIAQVPGPNLLKDLEFQRAWNDLEYISSLPHPYNSKQNEHVRSYILKSMRELEATNQSYITVIDDTLTNITFESTDNDTLTYFEGDNILVKFEGKSKDLFPILLSAHFDSVSTGYGATDDGMGVATVMAIARYYAKNQPNRDLIININNAEEDYLFGAKAFASHKLSKNVTAFVNLEGAGSGGKAMLFRSSNGHVSSAYFKGNHYPLASILGNDFFKRGVIRSQTDYIVYEKMHNHTAGLDIAFYENRDIYHTRKDDINHLMPSSLRHMMYTASNAVKNLLNDSKSDLTKFRKPMFFLAFGKYWQLNLPIYQVLNIIFAVICPIVLLSTLIRFPSLYEQLKKPRYTVCFVVSCIFVSIFDTLTVLLLTWINPYVINSHTGLILALFYLTNLIALAFSFRAAATHSKLSSEDLSSIEIVFIWYAQILWYLVFIVSVILSIYFQLGSTYWVTLSYLCTFTCCIMTIIRINYFVDNVVTTQTTHEEDALIGSSINTSSHQHYGSTLNSTPHRRNSIALSNRAHVKLIDNIWTVIYFIFNVPFPVFLCYDILVETILPAGSQTLTDSVFSSKLYKLVIFVVFLSLVNSGPFIFRALSKKSLAVLTMLWITLFVQALSVNPFTESAPLKLSFVQMYDMDRMNNTVYVKNISPFTQDVLSLNPHFLFSNGSCNTSLCYYESTDPDFGGLKTPMSIHIEREKHQLDISINSGSKWCYVDFNTSVFFEAINGNSISGMYSSVRMGQRSFYAPYTLNLTITEVVEAEVTCLYDDIHEGIIPAYNTFVEHLPSWVAGVKASTGLLKVKSSIVI